MSLPVFPAQGAIPPVSFYNLQGLAGWLNQNPTYKKYFVGFRDMFHFLYSATTTNLPSWYNAENVPLFSPLSNMSHQQYALYTKQLVLFQKVYMYNYEVYVNWLSTGKTPIYYRFSSYQEFHDHQAAVALINLMYPFRAMATAQDDDGNYLNWVIPFPL